MEKRVELKDSARFFFAPTKSKRLSRHRQTVEARLLVPPKFQFDAAGRSGPALPRPPKAVLPELPLELGFFAPVGR